MIEGPLPLRGITGALLTPFDPDGSVVAALLEPQREFLLSHVDAISVLGAEVSEYRMLTPGDRRTLLAEQVQALAGRIPVVAGVSAPTVHEVLELVGLAAEAGADFAQLLLPVRPWGGDPSTEELVRYVRRIAAESPLPLVLYHHPGAGADPSLPTLVELTGIRGVAALKDSSRDVSRNLQAVKRIQEAGRASYLATVQPLLAVLLAGGAGAMMPPPLTVLGAAIRDAVASGDLAAAARAETIVADFPARFSAIGLVPAAKAAMAALGRSVGVSASPFGVLMPAVQEGVAAAVEPLRRLADEMTRRS